MPVFSKRSKTALETCDVRLQRVLYEAINYVDFIVLEGHRGQEAQDRAVAQGFSKVKWPHGKHNTKPSKAADIAPWPGPGKEIDWKDTERFVYFAGWIMGIAAQLGIKLRWGGDWNMDTHVKDEKFRDLGHFELID